MPEKALLPAQKRGRKRWAQNIVVFLLAFTLCSLLIVAVILNRTRVERLTMEQLILEKSSKINDEITELLYKTQTLSALITQSGGELKDFQQIAATIANDPAIQNILIAPGGVVSDVYPLAENEAVIGLDYFSDGAGNREAMLAKELGQLVFGGPFNAVQGGQILVGRLPVYLDRPDGSSAFWGIVSVTLKYPDALEGVGLGELKIRGFAYEIWRINPDSSEKQIISSSGHSYHQNTRYIERHISIMNSNWYFRILPVRSWYEFPEAWLSILISVGVSLLITFISQSNRDLKILKDELEILSNTDPLTCIHNRRWFWETAEHQLERVARKGGESFVILLDLDHFKKINDQHSHQAGDQVLRKVTARTTHTLRPYDLFARFGGEEFIILVTDITKEDTILLAQRLRQEIASTPFDIKGTRITVTASFGVAPAAPVYSLEEAIALADRALYQAKDQGRNRVAFCEREGSRAAPEAVTKS